MAENAAAPAEAPEVPEGAGEGPSNRPRVWLDMDINETRAAYQRAVDFVANRNLAYSLTSDRLEQLGGAEKKRIKDQLYPSDYEWSQKGRIAVVMPPERLTFELWPDVAPLAVQNFMCLCTGNKGIGSSGRPMHYKGSKVHRLLKDFILQGGDFVMGNGTGGESVYGKPFKDDKGGLKVKVDRRGLLCMGNSGKNSNTSQFFITLSDAKNVQSLTGKHVVFGELVDGEQVLNLLERCIDPAGGEQPAYSIHIADCGVMPETLNELQKHQCGLI